MHSISFESPDQGSLMACYVVKSMATLSPHIMVRAPILLHKLTSKILTAPLPFDKIFTPKLISWIPVVDIDGNLKIWNGSVLMNFWIFSERVWFSWMLDKSFRPHNLWVGLIKGFQAAIKCRKILNTPPS